MKSGRLTLGKSNEPGNRHRKRRGTSSRRVDAMARVASADAIRLDAQEVLQREIQRREREDETDREFPEEAWHVNKPNIRLWRSAVESTGRVRGGFYAVTRERPVRQACAVRPGGGNPIEHRTDLHRLSAPRTQEIRYPADDCRNHRRSPSAQTPTRQAQERTSPESSSHDIDAWQVSE